MSKKILALALVVVLAVTAVTGATLAYFTDDEKATNTMTVGKVDIDIDELAYVDGQYVKFENDEFTLIPQKDVEGAVNNNKVVYTFNNSYDNTKTTDVDEGAAYIRTIILIERPEGNPNSIAYNYDMSNWGDKRNDDDVYFLGVKEAGVVENVTIGTTVYDAHLFVDVEEKAIPSGKAQSTLASVWMKEDTTNEQAELYGAKVDILVYAQAVQSVGVADHAEAMKILNGGDDELTADEIAKLFTETENEAYLNNHFGS